VKTAIDGVEQLPSHRDERLQFGLVPTQQAFIERLQVRIAANRNQSRSKYGAKRPKKA